MLHILCKFNLSDGYVQNVTKLIQNIIKNNTKIILINSCDYGKLNFFSPAVYNFIKNKLNVTVINIATDSVMQKINNEIFASSLIDKHIILDSKYTFSNIKNKVFVPTPYPMKWFTENKYEKTIEVSFIGGFSSFKKEREEYCKYLSEKNINIEVYGTGQGSINKIPREEYLNIIKNSKISINFSGSHNCLYTQLKGRVLEIIFSKTLLLEYDNDNIKEFFIPFIDYVPFFSKEDLLFKINYYLNNEEEREVIINNAQKKASLYYKGSNILKNEFSTFLWNKKNT